MKKKYLECGKIVTTSGIKGEVKVQSWCDSPDVLLDFNQLFLDEQGTTVLEIEKSRVQKNVIIFKIKNVETIEEARTYINKILYLDRENLPMQENEYFIQDLIGLSVNDVDTGICYGKIIEVSPTGANDVYHIQSPNGKILLIPAIKKVVIKTDIENQIMLIKPLEGLFDD